MDVTGSESATVGRAAEDEAPAGLGAHLQAQRVAFLAGSPASADLRVDRIERVIELIVSSADRLVEALRADYGHRSPVQSVLSDVLGPLPGIKHTRSHVKRWMRPQRYGAGPLALLGARASVEWQPLGVVGVISPWNFPVGLTFDPVAQAFAAGNHVMVKLSESVPATSSVIQEEIAQRFDPTELIAVCGGPEVGAAFAALPFDHLLLTGSSATGRHVQRAAAENLVPVTLELGGKDPVVVTPSADLRLVAERVLAGKTMNAGQLCLAPDYVLLIGDRTDELVAEFRTVASRMLPRVLDNPDYSSILDGRHHSRLIGLLDDARVKGATVIELRPDGENFQGQPSGVHKIPPTVLLNVTPQMAVMQEEIFGPVLPIVVLDTVEQAVTWVNTRPRPLAAYVFGDDDPVRRTVVERVLCGGMTINDVILHYTVPALPFGGVGDSGMGGYRGRRGFETFSHPRGTLAVSRLPSPNVLMGAPYSPLTSAVLRGVVRAEAWRAQRRVRRSARRVS